MSETVTKGPFIVFDQPAGDGRGDKAAVSIGDISRLNSNGYSMTDIVLDDQTVVHVYGSVEATAEKINNKLKSNVGSSAAPQQEQVTEISNSVAEKRERLRGAARFGLHDD